MSSSFPPPPILSFAEMATSISEHHQAHAHILKSGLIHSTSAASRLIASVSNNPHAQAIPYAHSIFSRVPDPSPFMWNTIIRAYATSPTPEAALVLFHQMLSASVLPDKYTFTFALKSCGSFSGVEEGRQVHGHALKIGFGGDLFIQNTLIHLYASCGCFEDARDLLDRMPERDVVSWNALLSAYVERGLMESASDLFGEMPQRNVESWNFMISGYVGLGLIEDAWRVFDEMPAKNVVSWNAMITGYAHVSCFGEVLVLFEEMQRAGVKPDNCTLVNVLSACAHVGALGQGEWVHAYIDKNGISIGGFVATALVDMYSKCGSIEKALEVFNSCSRKDISTWNSIMSGLSIHGSGQHAIQIFSEMLEEGFEPNEVTFVCVLSACSRAGLLDEGHEMFNHMVHLYGIQPAIEHYGCMVDLLGRVGLLEEAEELVQKIPQKEASVVWESLLGACRNHGNVEMAERVAQKLLELSPQESSSFVQLSNMYASEGRWKDAMEVRQKMRAQGVRKGPGCSMIEVDGIVYEFLSGEGLASGKDLI